MKVLGFVNHQWLRPSAGKPRRGRGPVSVVPVGMVAALAAGVILTANLIALGPAFAGKPLQARQLLREL